MNTKTISWLRKFLSTPSARRATDCPPKLIRINRFLSTPSARRATRRGHQGGGVRLISIHALREEGDAGKPAGSPAGGDFYPRPPRGGRPGCSRGSGRVHQISIHALREEGDVFHGACNVILCNFYPRPPRGGRPTTFSTAPDSFMNFYPRPPRGGRPQGQRSSHCGHQISIHALREEGDPRCEGCSS